jgi:Adenine deaminase C-terminal domain
MGSAHLGMNKIRRRQLYPSAERRCAVVCEKGKIAAELPLPIFGIMSELPIETIADQLRFARESVSFLTVVPCLPISDNFWSIKTFPQLNMLIVSASADKGQHFILTNLAKQSSFLQL